VGFPWAEVAADGSSVIGKHDGTGGLVSVGTVTAQLLYEIAGPSYANPDVTARFDTIALTQVTDDRVAVTGVKGYAAPRTAKVALTTLGGFRNSASLVLTGLDIEAKADLALRTIAGIPLAQALSATAQENAEASRLDVHELDVQLLRRDREDPRTTADAQAELRLTVKATDPKAVGKAFTAPIVESALGSYPGMFPTAPPSDGTPFGVYWPTAVDADLVTQTVMLDIGTGEPVVVATVPSGTSVGPVEPDDDTVWASPAIGYPVSVRAPIGSVYGARSGDKGGNANLGVWAPATGVERVDFARSVVLGHLLGSPAAVRRWLPEAEGLEIEIHHLPNLRAINVVIHGWLGRGVADSTSLDPQAKGLAEHFRARVADLPTNVFVEAGDA